MATLDIKDGRYFALILFVYGEQDRDWLANVWREGDGPWHFDYRFRYYAGTGNDDDDEKSGYECTMLASTSEEEVCAKARIMADVLVKVGFNNKLDVIEPKTDRALKVAELMNARPWCRMKARPGMATA